MKDRNLKRACVIYQDDDFGKALLAGYQKAVKELGLNSVAEIAFKRGAKDFSAEVLTLKDKGVTAVYLGTLTTESAAVMSEFRRLDMKVTDVEYQGDGTKATIEQQAHDVVTFLAWAAEPKMEERKHLGFGVMIFLIVLAGLLFASYRKIWKDAH